MSDGPAARGVLLFGGSFDPIHHGHLIVSRAAAEELGLDQVVLIPAANPPHKDAALLTPAEHRLAMCRLAVDDDPQFEVSAWEIARAGPNYSLHTVRHFQKTLPAGSRIHWLLGMDSLLELASWHRPAELASACTLVTAVRPGCEAPDLESLGEALSPKQIAVIEEHILETPLIDIRATAIRARVRGGQSIRHLVPERVRGYIAEHRLFVGKRTAD